MNLSYKSAGVNISEADKFVRKIKPLVKQTFSEKVLKGIGSFGAFYKPDFSKYREPVLVSSIDGVGTKLKIAAELKRFDTIGEDLVNHCVNDIAVCGAVPLFFLDYYATGKLNSKEASDVIKGIVRGCRRNGCSLTGGETAEMPGIYRGKDFDLAGAITGVAEKKNILNPENVKKGNVLVGLKSNGLHTNGYSLARKVFYNRKKLNEYISELKCKAGDELLKVHRSYLDVIQSALKEFKINSISHITGGGIIGNTKRVVPDNLKIIIDWNSWKRPAIFNLIQIRGNVKEPDMRRTFNLGIGLIFIIDKNYLNDFTEFLKFKKEKFTLIGSIQ